MSDEIIYLPSVDGAFCERLATEIAGITFQIGESAGGEDTGTRWAVTTAYGETFRSIMFDGQDDTSFAPEGILDAARRITGRDEVVVFRSQANVMLSGQGLGRHTDVPQFHRARRWTFPDWLLVAMLHSGLYDEDQVRIVSAVVWPMETNGGDLCIFDRADTRLLAAFPPAPGAAVVSDTYRLPHEVAAIPGEEVVVGPGDRIGLDGEAWRLRRTDGPEAVLGRDQVRTSVLIKFACFRDAAERERYFSPVDEMWDERDVIAALRDRLPPGQRDRLGEGDELHQQLVDAFVSYM